MSWFSLNILLSCLSKMYLWIFESLPISRQMFFWSAFNMKLFISLFSVRPSYPTWVYLLRNGLKKKHGKQDFSQHSLSNLQIPPFPIAYFNYTKVDWWKPPLAVRPHYFIGKNPLQPEKLSKNISNIFLPLGVFYVSLGKGPATKSDEFSEKFQTAFDPPPPHFRKIILQIFSPNFMLESPNSAI